MFHGGPSGLSAVPAQTWTGPAQDGQFGAIVSPAGDVNGDGFADILVGAPLLTVAFAQGGAAYLYLGTSGGALAGPDTLIYGTEANENLGMGIGNAGDVNGDGYADVLVGSPNFGPNNEGRCRFLYGGPNGIASGFFLSNSETGPNENFGLGAKPWVKAIGSFARRSARPMADIVSRCASAIVLPPFA